MKMKTTHFIATLLLFFALACNTSSVPKSGPSASVEKNNSVVSTDCIDESLKGDYPCTKENNPVCGCDGITYGNPCLAKKAGVSKTTPGPCGSSSNKKDMGYIIQLDPTAFPEIENFKKANPGSDRPDPSGNSEFDKFVRKQLMKFANEKLDIKPEQITQVYSGIMLGFAATIPANQLENFLAKVKTTKEITSYEEDGTVEIR